MNHIKSILILCLLAVLCATSCKKDNPKPVVKTKLQLHMDSLAVAVKGTWLYNLYIIKIGPSAELSGDIIINPYNITLDGNSNALAQSAIYGANASSNVTATYKLINENGTDFIIFYNSANSVIGKASIIFPDNNALNIEGAQEINLYFNDGDMLSPIISDPNIQQMYSFSPKFVQYERKYN